MEFFKISQSTIQPIWWNIEQYLSFLIELRLFSVSKHVVFILFWLRIAEQQLSSHDWLTSNRFERDRYSRTCDQQQIRKRVGCARISWYLEFIGPDYFQIRAFDYRPTFTRFRVAYIVWHMHVEQGINYRDFMALKRSHSWNLAHWISRAR